MKLSDLQDQVTAQIIELMEQDGVAWVKRWATPLPPCNGVSGHIYKGMNTITTGLWLMLNGQDDPRFITSGVAFSKDPAQRVGQVRKGSKTIPIIAAGNYRKEVEGREEFHTFYKVFRAFHVSQFDDLDEAKLIEVQAHAPETDAARRDAHVDAWVAETGAVIKDATAAFYDNRSDQIGMPPLDTFLSHGEVRAAEFYYATLLHELTHWTGHPRRLDRKTLAHYGRSKADRAFEELIAEIGSVMLSMQLGVQPCPREDNAAYVKGWITHLKNRPKAIFEAAAAASKSAAFLDEIRKPQEQAA